MIHSLLAHRRSWSQSDEESLANTWIQLLQLLKIELGSMNVSTLGKPLFRHFVALPFLPFEAQPLYLSSSSSSPAFSSSSSSLTPCEACLRSNLVAHYHLFAIHSELHLLLHHLKRLTDDPILPFLTIFNFEKLPGFLSRQTLPHPCCQR